jgi:hypothetical protein
MFRLMLGIFDIMPLRGRRGSGPPQKASPTNAPVFPVRTTRTQTARKEGILISLARCTHSAERQRDIGAYASQLAIGPGQ